MKMTAISIVLSSLAAGSSPAFASEAAFQVLADSRVGEPIRAIATEYENRSGSKISIEFLPASKIHALLQKKSTRGDLEVCMSSKNGNETPVSSLPGARKVARKYPTGEPVWAAVLTENSGADRFYRFLGGPTGHRLWSESKAGFTIPAGKTHAETHQWVVENRVKRTYPMTAMRMLAECGGIRQGICIDLGCGSGQLDVELARRSQFTIIGLDIDPEMKRLFEKTVREAGFEKRISFVQGDAQDLPFPENHADLIVSRGMLPFVPDLKKCLQEVHRVLKPTGVAFLGGRYLYTPQVHKIPTEKLRQIVAESEVPGAQVIDSRGQWVKIIGPQAPEAAKTFQGGPHMLANRLVADYAITEGRCLVICGGDGGLEQGLQRGIVEQTNLKITALYPSEKVARQAETRLKNANLSSRITCRAGQILALPFEENSFDLIAGVGPVLIWGDRETAMREVYRVLRPGGAARIGGRYLGMPESRKVSSQALRESAARTGIRSIQVSDDMGQWVIIRKGIGEWEFQE